MGNRVEYDPRKAASNLRKHGVSFAEALTTLTVRLPRRCRTIGTPARSSAGLRLACPRAGASSLSFTLIPTPRCASSARGSRLLLSAGNMKKSAKLDPLAPRPNLDFSKGVRGKYSNLLAEGTNVAVIDPALQNHFPDSESVNRALRALLAIREQLKQAAPKRSRAA
jgi:hypothetical protein